MDIPSAVPAVPWRLRGNAWLSAWAVPHDELPAVDPGLRPLRLGGRGLVLAAWVDYDERGQLAYSELLLAVAVRDGAGIAVTIPAIWVDSAVSMHGARTLWRIPKELADFDFGFGSARLSAAATGAAGLLATATFRHRRGPALRLPARLRVRQHDTRCPVRLTGRAHLASARWQPQPGSPLAFLAGRAPLASARIADFRMRFG